MAVPIQGHEGSISVTIETVATPVGWVNTWTASLGTTEQELGPFIGDGGKTYVVTTARTLTGSLEATVPKSKDAGQTALITGAIEGDSAALTLTTTDGYVITMPTAVITGWEMTQDGAETVTVTFDFRSNGAFTVV